MTILIVFTTRTEANWSSSYHSTAHTSSCRTRECLEDGGNAWPIIHTLSLWVVLRPSPLPTYYQIKLLSDQCKRASYSSGARLYNHSTPNDSSSNFGHFSLSFPPPLFSPSQKSSSQLTLGCQNLITQLHGDTNLDMCSTWLPCGHVHVQHSYRGSRMYMCSTWLPRLPCTAHGMALVNLACGYIWEVSGLSTQVVTDRLFIDKYHHFSYPPSNAMATLPLPMPISKRVMWA